ncbi:MAG: type II toxin-antitoxin system VapC family toxin [Acidimicrobiales bacterium]|nr:type II toxin-antitoxin system VapC family toxin [Acidimicrobiales bacterium]
MTAETSAAIPGSAERGLLDTNVMILRHRIDASELPDEVAISAVTLAELAAGVHLVDESAPDAAAERARRTDVLQRAESDFDPFPFDAAAARMFGRVSAAVRSIGRTPRRRSTDLMIASVAAANQLPLYTTNPDDFAGLDDLVDVVALTPVPPS